MKFISVIFTFITMIHCGEDTEGKKLWTAQLAGVFFDENGDTYIIINNEGINIESSKVVRKSFELENLSIEAQEIARKDCSDNLGSFLETPLRRKHPVSAKKYLSLHSYTFEPFNFSEYDFSKDSTLKCMVIKILKEKLDKNQYDKLFHIELKFNKETSDDIIWDVIKISDDPLKEESDDDFKNWKNLKLKKAIYFSKYDQIRQIEVGLRAYKVYKVNKFNESEQPEEFKEVNEDNKKNEIGDIKKINYNDSCLFTFEELRLQKANTIVFLLHGVIFDGTLDVNEFISENEKKEKQLIVD